MGKRINRIPIACQYTNIAKMGLSDLSMYWIIPGSRFGCRFTLKPSPISNTYNLRLCYKQGEYPDVYVESPKPLELADGCSLLEHVYSTEKQHLCLFIRGAQEWNSSMLISNTVIPWASEWLLHYELWVLTGVWNGGGIHPTADKNSAKNSESNN